MITGSLRKISHSLNVESVSKTLWKYYLQFLSSGLTITGRLLRPTPDF